MYTSDGTTFATAGTTSTLTVTQATPTITWADPAAIIYGTAISAAQLDATASIPGILTYKPALGAILKAGSDHTLSVTFTPTDSTDYTAASASVTIDVGKATPTVSWADPADIIYGTALSATQLDATASVTGHFTYNPAPGDILNAGSDQTLSVTFTPTDSTDYTAASASVTIDVDKATPNITWADPADIIYGTALSATQLDATASVPGTLTYTPALGAILEAGGNQTLSVTFTPSDSTDFGGASASVMIDVDMATPSMTWADPADIVYGTALSATQLDATASVPGTFTYTPALGTFLSAGAGQTLSAAFTPTDTTDFNATTVTALIDVIKATPALNVTDPGGVFDGHAYPASVTITGVGADDPPAASLESVTPTLTYWSGAGTSGPILGSTPPTDVGTYTVVAAFLGTADYLSAQSAPVTFTIARAMPTIAMSASSGSAAYGQPETLTVAVTAPGSPAGAITFLDGQTVLGTVALGSAGTATLSVSALDVGSHSIVATYGGATDYLGVQSVPVSVAVAQASIEIAIVPQPVYKKKKIVSLSLKAVISTLAPRRSALGAGHV